MYQDHPSGKRLPPIASRTQIPQDELEDYDDALAQVRQIEQRTSDVDGAPYGYAYMSALTNAPRIRSALISASNAIRYSQGQPGSFSFADHEMIDQVLGFDSGYWGMQPGHTPNAIAAGIRIEALEALRDGREEELTPDEKKRIEFIRAVRDGAVTDELWAQMVERLGTVRGTIEYAFFICNLLAQHRLMWALGVPGMMLDDFNQMLQDFKDGTRDPRAEAVPGWSQQPIVSKS